MYQLQFYTILECCKTPKFTDFDDDLYETIPFQKSHFSLLQIMEWLINTDTYARESPRSAMHGYVRFKLPAFNALDEANNCLRSLRLCVACRVGNVTFFNESIRGNRRQTRLILGLLEHG